MGKNRVTAVFTVFLAFLLFVAMKPGDNPVILMRVATITAVVVFLGMILYTRILWKVPPFCKMHKIVNIGGKWQGKIMVGNEAVYDVEATITQYLSDIKIKIKTDNFYNDSLACTMSSDNQGVKLYTVYKSKPSGRVDSKDQIEYGTFIINCDEDILEGIFYASSKLSGKVELYRK